MNDFGSLHYNAIGPWLKREFGERVVKLSLDGGFTCPNRDGRVGTGGCIFCSEDGSGTFTGTIEQQMQLLRPKWPDAKYIAYFQSHTATYASPENLRALWDGALAHDKVMGLAAATRPDCLGPDILDLLDEYNRKTFLWVELGLQTSNENTANYINRCYNNDIFEQAAKDLSERNIRFVVHLILGLPGESRADMLASSMYAASFKPFGLKLHMLHIMKGTRLAAALPPDYVPMDRNDYTELVIDILERIPGSITIHRLTGDAPKSTLIAPLWTADKHAVLNGIQRRFKERETYQGRIVQKEDSE